ncbi:hypothetical protein ACHAWO_001546 [Cyclotella atomus]|uniref:Uncharacterized protein n=1 Tax=Cyclotella atomus TaxID=382360 RepID=A0ABD3PLN1_9STRA
MPNLYANPSMVSTKISLIAEMLRVIMNSHSIILEGLVVSSSTDPSEQWLLDDRVLFRFSEVDGASCGRDLCNVSSGSMLILRFRLTLLLWTVVSSNGV